MCKLAAFPQSSSWYVIPRRGTEQVSRTGESHGVSQRTHHPSVRDFPIFLSEALSVNPADVRAAHALRGVDGSSDGKRSGYARLREEVRNRPPPKNGVKSGKINW